jgi:hypothetical protein
MRAKLDSGISRNNWTTLFHLCWRLRPDEIVDGRECCKIPEFFENSPLSGAAKHPDFQVTSCHQNVSTNANFAYIEYE